MTKVKKFRIQNYKSIIDSGDCYLQDTITILAGKNESGKTSILEALEDFEFGRNIRDSAIPTYNTDAKPKITVTFVIKKESLNEIFEEIKYNKKATSDAEVTLTKEFPNVYSFHENSLEIIIPGIISNEIATLTEIRKSLDNIKAVQKNFPVLGTIFTQDPRTPNFDSETFKIQFVAFLLQIKANIGKITDDNARKSLQESLDLAEKSMEEYEKLLEIKNKFKSEFEKYAPAFILFSSFEDVLPPGMPISEIENKEIAKDLAKIGNLDIEKLKAESNSQQRKQHKTEINALIKGDFLDYWRQNEVTLEIETNGNNLEFFIMDDGQPFLPTQRSKGFQWFLSFYIRLQARFHDDFYSVLLIDEPGLYLHAKAQRDVLHVLNDISKENQVVFSTHQPYLIDPKNLSRLRLVTYSDKERTKIKKLHAGADKETLTPILTAIGDDLALGIRVDRKNSIVVEGISDYYYLQAFNKLTDSKISDIVPATGGNSPLYVGTVLFGWGLDPVFCLDSDKSGNHLKNELKDKLAIEQNKIVFVIDKEGSIEDVFSKNDFKKYILNEDINYTVTNSEYVKKTDKVLFSKKFFDDVSDEKLDLSNFDKETIKNIKSLIKALEDAIKK